jgi:CRISPR-associated protein (TIGR03984 family)
MRAIENIKLKIDTEVKTDELAKDLKDWLEKKVDLFANAYLLSFHDDGVVWGKLQAENGPVKLLTSDKLKDSQGKLFFSPSPEFRIETMQECRLFSDKGELYVWRNGSGFKARLIEDDKTASADERNDEYFDEKQILWGTQIKNGNDGFTIVADGSEGLHHAFPHKVEANKFDGKKRPLRLCVRHYLDYDDDDCAYISLSRLVNVDVE